MPACRHLILAALAAASASAAGAAPKLHPLFSDHAVLQRGRPIAVWGSADPGERVTVAFAGASTTVRAGKDGSWQAGLPAAPVGGPYTLTATGKAGSTAKAEDVLVGDVWLCSGQSNMEFPLSRALNPDSEISSANDAELRLLTVPKKTQLAPSGEFAGPVAWSVTSPQTVAGFSAACYFMARDLRGSEKVPIGAINASWGGTAIRSWLDEAGARRTGSDDAALLELYRREPADANARFGQLWQTWWQSRNATTPWSNTAALDWKPMPKIGYWENWGDADFKAFNGMVWARKVVRLTREQAARPATLSLGVIDEIDETWVNGVPVGNTFGWDVERNYTLPSGLLHEGDNEILVNLLDNWGYGGFQGPGAALKLSLAGSGDVPLGEGWSYALAGETGSPPRTPWDAAAGLGLIYNGMIAPLGTFALKGAAWYQGETDAGSPTGYADKLAALMQAWRAQFDAPQLPFLIVSLANYGDPVLAPRSSGWAEIRDAQRIAAERDPNAALVVAMDLGERQDIHPPNKLELGRRLSRAARALAYGAKLPASGPEIAGAAREGGDIVLTFNGVTGRLHSWSSAHATAFELCGATQESCRFADATVAANTVRVKGDGLPVSRVRYAWGETPIVNLYDEAPLPAGPFEVPIGR